jgi:methionyl-tRNA formyltransferase
LIRLAVLSPIANSLYSRLVAHLAAAEPEVQVVAIVTRTPWSLNRIRSEFRRDGARLIGKVRRKLVVGEENATVESKNSIGAMARGVGLRDASLGAFAARLNIPYIKAVDHNEPRVLAALREAAPDLVAFTGGGMIRKDLLSIPRLGILNCHCGILPLYRGMDVVEWPATEGRLHDIGIGMTLHFMNEGLDTGPILLRRRIELERGCSFDTIRERIGPEMVNLMLEGIRGLRDGTIETETQALSDGRQYYVMHPRIYEFATKQVRKFLEGGCR